MPSSDRSIGLISVLVRAVSELLDAPGRRQPRWTARQLGSSEFEPAREPPQFGRSASPDGAGHDSLDRGPAPLAVYALRIGGSRLRRERALAFCLDVGVLGVGWGLGPGAMDWTAYRRRALVRDGVVPPDVQTIHDLPDESLIWTSDPATGRSYLARVIGPWRYLHGDRAVTAEIHNVRPVQMIAREEAAVVPGAVIELLARGRRIERIGEEALAASAASQFAELTIGADQPLPLDEILTRHLSDEEVRDLVCRYLHRRYGYLPREPDRRRTFGSWEYILHNADGHKAIIRARRGLQPVPRNATMVPTHKHDRVFVFSPTGTYVHAADPSVTEIAYRDIVAFLRTDLLRPERPYANGSSRLVRDPV